MPETTLHIHVSADCGPAVDADVLVVADPSERLIDAAERAVRDQVDARFEGKLVGIIWNDPEYPDRLMQLYPVDLTVGATRAYFGEEADESPATIILTTGGFGGDAQLFAYAIDFVIGSLGTVGTVQTALSVQRAAIRVRYRRFRDLAKQWNDSEYLSPDLVEAVCADPVWRRDHFDRVFGLDEHRGPLLLRTLGYERWSDSSSERWHRTNFDVP
ncbi:hypothetical protein [Agromyces sp. LHK192]|uniref:hypothetical protein n=1 Tax=Agromyces sp. LHK192 TaxID=2498704 RepID=UPI000FD8B6E9|nr:hypothetical protein [Agromyces sp. LHK192]